MSFLMWWWVPHLWTRTTWQEYSRVSRRGQEPAICDLRDLFHFEILWLHSDYKMSLSRSLSHYKRMYKWKLPQCLGYNLELWLASSGSAGIEVLSDCALCLRATDHDFGAKYSLESTTVSATMSQCSRLASYLGV